MSESATSPANQIKKLQIKETVLFAINHIPAVDRATLEKFLELVNATGTFGAMTPEQVLARMEQTLKYVPGASGPSLLILADLLEIRVPPGSNFHYLLTSQSPANPLLATTRQSRPMFVQAR